MDSVEHNSHSPVIADMLRGCQLAQMVSVAARLRIADHLQNGPLTASTLAEFTGNHEDSLYRLLRALAGLGIFAEEPGRHFRLNGAAEPLLSAIPGSMRIRAQVIGEPWMWNSWGALSHSVRTGETAFDHIYGQSTFDWFSAHPEAARVFDAFQAEVTAGLTNEILSAFDFSHLKLVVDVAGGTGTLLSEILRRFPKTRGILFDLEHAIRVARKSMDQDFASRCEFVSGNMFQNVPEGAELYILKSVIHDWNDDQAKSILTSCRRAMKRETRLLLIERLVCNPNEYCEAKLMDVLMMVRTGGRERTREEYEELLKDTGLRITRIFPTGQGFHLLEAAIDG